MDNLLYLPVSLGEGIDKLTILDIKLDKIKDDRKRDVQKEYDLLYGKLKEFIIKYENLYKTMKQVNLLIWDMMDILRNETTNENQYLKICKECTDYNDVRFRIKNKINCISGSVIKEQKSYKINRYVIGLNTLIQSSESIFVKIVKHLSFMYDEIWIASDLPQDLLKEYFNYDTTILFKPAKNSNCTADDKDKTVVENESNLYQLFNIQPDKLFI
jgi:hypothetical protein